MLPVKVRSYSYYAVISFLIIFCGKSEVGAFIVGVTIH